MLESTQLPLVIEPEELAAQLDNDKLLIIDLSQAQVYMRAHVPGAVHLPFSRLVSGKKPATGSLPSVSQLEEVFSELGLTPDAHVVAYDDEGGGWAGRLIWTLDMIGHTNYSYLNGGIHAWLEAKQPIQKEAKTRPATEVKVSLAEQPAVDREYILKNLENDQVVVWDARSKEEYLGTRSFAQKAGHIPGAKHFEWTAAMDRDRQLRIIELDTLRAQLADLGITEDKEIITHCQTHHRSGFTYLLGKVLGFPNIRAYPGSWSEWGNHPDSPVETDLN